MKQDQTEALKRWLAEAKRIAHKPVIGMTKREKLIRFGCCTPEQADALLKQIKASKTVSPNGKGQP